MVRWCVSLMSELSGGASQGGSCRMDVGLIGLLTLRTTDEVPPAHRVQFWRDEVLRFIEPDPTFVRAEPFQAEIRRVQGRKAEIVELVSDSMTANRNAVRCRRD